MVLKRSYLTVDAGISVGQCGNYMVWEGGLDFHVGGQANNCGASVSF